MVKCCSNGHHVFLREPESLGLNYMNRVGGYSRWVLIQWLIQGRAPPHLFLDQTEAQRAKKIF